MCCHFPNLSEKCFDIQWCIFIIVNNSQAEIENQLPLWNVVSSNYAHTTTNSQYVLQSPILADSGRYSLGSGCPCCQCGYPLPHPWGWYGAGGPLKRKKTSLFSSFPNSFTISLDVTELTVVLEAPGYMVQGCTVPLEPREDLVVLEDHVGLVPHVAQEDRVGHLLE